MGVIKMISAKEAYEMTKEKDKAMETQLKEIENEIIKAVENGDYSLKWESALNQNVVRYLEHLGYHVTEFRHRDDVYHKIYHHHYWIQWG